MIERHAGARTVPQIWIGERHVGGFDDLAALERAGELDALLGASRTGAGAAAERVRLRDRRQRPGRLHGGDLRGARGARAGRRSRASSSAAS